MSSSERRIETLPLNLRGMVSCARASSLIDKPADDGGPRTQIPHENSASDAPANYLFCAQMLCGTPGIWLKQVEVSVASRTFGSGQHQGVR